MEFVVPVVLHTEFGGFHLTGEMIERLTKRKCEWVSKCRKTEGSNPRWYMPFDDGSNELRRDPDLVAVVQELADEYEKACEGIEVWQERTKLRQTMLANLEVVHVRVVIEIDDHDGRETVHVTGGAW